LLVAPTDFLHNYSLFMIVVLNKSFELNCLIESFDLPGAYDPLFFYMNVDGTNFMKLNISLTNKCP